MGSPEFALLAQLSDVLAGDGPGVPLGVGDDAAVVEVAGAAVAIAVDTLVDGVHFDRTLSSWSDVGWKAVTVNVSDLLAVAARPRAAVVSLQRPAGLPDADVHELYAGIDEAAATYGLAVVGGDTVSAAQVAVSVTVLGELLGTGPLRRDGARVGDDLVLVHLDGRELGRAAAALALHRAGITANEVFERLAVQHRRPLVGPVTARTLLAARATSAIDVSDGLGRDVAHIAEMSGVAIEVARPAVRADDDVREAAGLLGRDADRFVVAGGDDYALVGTVPADTPLDPPEGVVARRIGRVVDGPAGQVTLVAANGDREEITLQGWEHTGDDR